MTKPPLVSWYEGTNSTANEVKTTVDFGTVDADSQSETKTLYIWNNRGGNEDCSKMEEVTYTTRDRNGGVGDTVGNIVEAVKDNWFNVRVDTLEETTFTPVGKGGIGTVNPQGTKVVGTNGSTTNINASTAIVWSVTTPLLTGDYVQPTVSNGFIYKVLVDGETGTTEPTWNTVENNEVFDGTLKYIAIKIEQTPKAKEILGLANSVKTDGSNAALAAGNFVKISVYADVPITASAGKNLLVQRVSYRYV